MAVKLMTAAELAEYRKKAASTASEQPAPEAVIIRATPEQILKNAVMSVDPIRNIDFKAPAPSAVNPLDRFAVKIPAETAAQNSNPFSIGVTAPAVPAAVNPAPVSAPLMAAAAETAKINRNNSIALDIAKNSNSEFGTSGQFLLFVRDMPYEDQITYGRLVYENGKKIGEQKFRSYLNDKSLKIADKLSRENPVFKNLYNPALSLMSSFAKPLYMGEVVGQNIKNIFTGRNDSVPDYSGGSQVMKANQAAGQNFVAGDAPVTAFMKNVGISIADNVIKRLAYGIAAPAVMGIEAGASSAYDAKEKGAGGFGQLAIGTLGGAAEFAGETVSFKGLDKIIKEGGTKGLKEILKLIAAQFVTEGSEEMATEVLNIASDLAVMRDKSDIARFVKDYKAKNPGKDATLATGLEILKQVSLAGLAGGISGGVMGGGAVAVSKSVDAANNKKNAQMINGAIEAINTLVPEANIAALDVNRASAEDIAAARTNVMAIMGAAGENGDNGVGVINNSENAWNAPINSEFDEIMSVAAPMSENGVYGQKNGVYNLNVGDVLTAAGNGNKITVLGIDGANAKILVDTGAEQTESIWPVKSIERDLQTGNAVITSRQSMRVSPETAGGNVQNGVAGQNTNQSAAQSVAATENSVQNQNQNASQNTVVNVAGQAVSNSVQNGMPNTAQNTDLNGFKRAVYETATKKGKKSVKGFVYGGVGINKDAGGKEFNIIHLNSGLRIDSAKSLKVAEKKARYLADSVDMTQNGDDREFLNDVVNLVAAMDINPSLYMPGSTGNQVVGGETNGGQGETRNSDLGDRGYDRPSGTHARGESGNQNQTFREANKNSDKERRGQNSYREVEKRVRFTTNGIEREIDISYSELPKSEYTEEHKAAVEHNNKYGFKTVFFDGSLKTYKGGELKQTVPVGTTIGDTVYINTNGNEPYINVSRHELVHAIKRKNIPLYENLRDTLYYYFYVKKFTDKIEAGRSVALKAYSESEIDEDTVPEELIAHLSWQLESGVVPDFVADVDGAKAAFKEFFSAAIDLANAMNENPSLYGDTIVNNQITGGETGGGQGETRNSDLGDRRYSISGDGNVGRTGGERAQVQRNAGNSDAEVGNGQSLYREVEKRVSAGKENGREVTVTYSELPENEYNEKHKAAVKHNERYGFKTVFFGGTLQAYDGNKLLRNSDVGTTIGDTVYINANTSHPYINVSLHELIHGIKRSNRPLYNKLYDTLVRDFIYIKEFTDKIAEYANKAANYYTADETNVYTMSEEVIADLAWQLESGVVPDFVADVEGAKAAFKEFFSAAEKTAGQVSDVGQGANSVDSNAQNNPEEAYNKRIADIDAEINRLLNKVDYNNEDEMRFIDLTLEKFNAEEEEKRRLEKEKAVSEHPRETSLIEKMAKKYGIPYYYEDMDAMDMGGYFDGKNIALNPNTTNLLRTFAHELTHYAENSKGYKNYVNELLNSSWAHSYFDRNNTSLDGKMREIASRYKDTYAHFDAAKFEDAIKRELVTELNAKLLNSTPETLIRLARQDTGFKRIINAIRDFFKDLAVRFTGTAEQKYALAMVKKFEGVLNEVEKGERSWPVQQSIYTDDTGRQVVKVEKNIFEGVPVSEWRKTLINHLYNNMAGKSVLTWTVNPNTGEIDDWDSAALVRIPNKGEKVNSNEALRKYPYPGKNLSVGQLNKRGIAASVADELLQSSEFSNYGSDKNQKHGNFAKQGWEYRKAYFEMPNGKIYEAYLNIALGDENILYDIEKIKETRSVGGRDLKNPPQPELNVSSNNTSITQNNPDVNSIIRKNSKNDTKGSNEGGNRGKNRWTTENQNNITGGAKNERDLRSDDSGKRAGSENTALKNGEVGRGAERNQGESYSARKLQAENARTAGQTKITVLSKGMRGEVVKEKAYTPEMKALVERNKTEYGLDTVLVVGSIQLFSKGNKNLRGANLGNGKIIVQYDNRSYTPRQISDHEAAHGRENTAAFRKVMNVVKNSLSVTEQNRIFDELYADYKGLENGDAEYILKEFICDVLSGMSEYSAQFADMSNAFWNGGDISAEAYSPAEYAGSIDAGGFADSVGFGDIIYSVDSSGKETVLPGNVTKADAIKALMSIAGKPLVNNETGIMAYVNSTQRKKIMSTQALEKSQNNGFTFNEHNAAVQNIVELFKRANLSERVEDKYGNANLNIARFTVPVAFDLGNNKTDRGQVKFTVKETVENGRRIYSLEIEQIETSQAIAVTATTSANAAPETLSNDIIHPDNENVNSILPENEKNIDDVRYSIETEDSDRQLTLEDWLSGLIDDYGYIEPGESPTREVKIPKQTGKDKYISKFARTALEAAATPDDGLSYFEEALRDGKMAHMRLTDAAASKFAKGKIEESGFDGALEYWDAAIKSDKNIDKNDLALGILLYNQAINAKDARTAMKVAVEISDAGTRAGQTVQAIRLLKKMTPDAQLYSLEKSVQSINRDIKEALKGKHPDVEIDEGLAQDLLDAKNEEERKKAREAILQNIADQIPSTVMDKWNAWRYLSMLGNLKTHIRNIVGNALFVPVIRLKNVVAAGLENAFIADTQNRTKALTAPKALKDFAKNDFKAVKDDIRGASGKYQTLNGIEERRKIFKTKWLEAARKFNFDMLEKEDLYFLRIAYTDSFAKIAAARGVTSEFLSDGSAKANETLELLREYAILEAQKATYRDLNDAARAISMAQRRWVKSDKLVVKAMGLSVESILPFKNTPANILKRGVEYSPLEFIKVLARDIGAVKKGEKTGSELIDDLAKGLVGSALLTLGMLLARWGLIRGAGDEDSKKDRFDKTNGLQPYALYVGGRSYTVDWMAPLSLPLFIGVELYGALNAGENFTFRKMTEAAAKITEPMLELSMLQGISGVLESVKYDEGNPTVAIASEAIVSYASQAAPTLLAQIARTTDNTRRTIYTDKNARLPAFVNETIQRIQTKLPVLNRLLQPSLDAWGREINYEDGYLGAAIENFISPGYFDTVEVNGVTKELNRLYSSQGENAVYPTKQGKSVTIDKRKIDFTGEQYTWFAKKRGELSLAKVKKVLQSGAYRASNDANKIKQIKAAYDDAYDETKKAFTKKYKK